MPKCVQQAANHARPTFSNFQQMLQKTTTTALDPLAAMLESSRCFNQISANNCKDATHTCAANVSKQLQMTGNMLHMCFKCASNNCKDATHPCATIALKQFQTITNMLQMCFKCASNNCKDATHPCATNALNNF